MFPFLLLCLGLTASSDKVYNFTIGAILEQSSNGDTWPIYPEETLDVATAYILDQFNINISLSYVFAECNTKVGLIKSTFLLVDSNKGDNVE